MKVTRAMPDSIIWKHDPVLRQRVIDAYTLAAILLGTMSASWEPYTLHRLTLHNKKSIPDQDVYLAFLEIIPYLERHQAVTDLDYPERHDRTIAEPSIKAVLVNIRDDLAQLPTVTVLPEPFVAPTTTCDTVGHTHIYMRTYREPSQPLDTHQPDLCCIRCQICDLYIGVPANYADLPLHPINIVQNTYNLDPQSLTCPAWLDPALWQAMLPHYQKR